MKPHTPEFDAMLIQLEQKIRQIQDVDAMREQLLSTVSHEMRTPLTIMLSAAENFSDGFYGPLTAQQTQFAEIMSNNVTRLLRIVNDFLDHSRLESGKTPLKIAQIDPHALLANDLSDAHRYAEQQQITIVSHCPLNVEKFWGDPTLIIRALHHLLANAIRMARHAVTIDASATKQGLRIAVSDDGPGIAQVDQRRIFMKFEQLQRPDGGAGYKGTGMGLTLCQQIAHLHHGELSVHSRPGHGATFHLVIPFDIRSRLEVKPSESVRHVDNP